MTLQQIFNYLGENPSYALFYFVMLPITALLGGFMSSGEGHLSPWKYFYATLVYLSCVPGIFAVVLCAYTFFFEPNNFLNVNVLVYFLPIISMILTLILIKQYVSFEYIPGFERLWGFLLVLAATFVIMLLIQKTNIWIVFVGKIQHLFFAFIVLFLLIRFGMSRLISGKS